MNSTITSKFRVYLTLFLFVGFIITTTSCSEEKKSSQTVKSKDVSFKKASDKKNNISNSKLKPNRTKQSPKNSEIKGEYWLALQSALNLSNSQLKCMKTARDSHSLKEKKLSKARGKANTEAQKKLLNEKVAKMKNCVGKDLYEKSRNFTVQWNKQRK